MIKALFLDIDGTLVSFETHHVPASAVEAITAARRRGVKVFIATGRPQVLINNLSPLPERGLIDGYVTMNGGYCFVGDEVVHKAAIPAADAHVLMDYCVPRRIPCIVVGEHDICVCQPNELVHQLFHQVLRATDIPEKSPAEALPAHKEVYQLTPFLTNEQEREIKACMPHCEFGRWHPAFADITARGNTKQLGIDQMCRHFGIRVEETMAVGDGGNDIPMLRHAGIGVAMGNANDDVKAAAKYVTDTVDRDGLARAIDLYAV